MTTPEAPLDDSGIAIRNRLRDQVADLQRESNANFGTIAGLRSVIKDVFGFLGQIAERNTSMEIRNLANELRARIKHLDESTPPPHPSLRSTLCDPSPPKTPEAPRDGALLPCPFCLDASPELTLGTVVGHIRCRKCGARSREFGYTNEIAEAWNTRATPAASAEPTQSQRDAADAIVRLCDLRENIEDLIGWTDAHVVLSDDELIDGLIRKIKGSEPAQRASADAPTKLDWGKVIADNAAKKAAFIAENQEKLLEAWVAEHGFRPSECELVIQDMAGGRTVCHVQKRASADVRDAKLNGIIDQLQPIFDAAYLAGVVDGTLEKAAVICEERITDHNGEAAEGKYADGEKCAEAIRALKTGWQG